MPEMRLGPREGVSPLGLSSQHAAAPHDRRDVAVGFGTVAVMMCRLFVRERVGSAAIDGDDVVDDVAVRVGPSQGVVDELPA